jgi:hypothetical protein
MRVIEKVDIATVEPLLCSVAAATAIIGRGERFVIDAIATGKIKGVKSDRRTLVVIESLHDYVAGLPAAVLKPDNREGRRNRATLPPLREGRRNRAIMRSSA